MSVDLTRQRQAEEALRSSEARYRSLFESINEGFCIIEMLFDDHGKPNNYRFLEVNPAFERHTGLVDATGRTALELIPELEHFWFERYGRVATTGEPERFVEQVGALQRWFEVDAFRLQDPQSRQIAVLFNDITEHRAAEQALRDSDRLKDEFLATLAHELRNPMAPLQSGLELLRLSAADPILRERALAIMERQMVHMKRLIDDLLDVSRISRGRIRLEAQTVDLNEAILAALDSNRAALHAGGRQVFVDLPPEPLMAQVDPVRFAQVISNLLDNAAKYTFDRGKIWISAARRDGAVRISVRDDGTGLAPDKLNHVFEMFIQLGGPGRGLGVGLALVQRLVALHGGRVQARSAGLGQGSEFIVDMPLGNVEDALPAAPAPTSTASLQGRRVLVVDDNHDAADSLSLLAKALGAEVTTTFDGASALAVVDEAQPEIVLLDIGMPGMDGYEVARRFRATPATRHALLVAVTGWGQAADRRRARAAGFDRHLVKPARLADLEAALAVQGPSIT